MKFQIRYSVGKDQVREAIPDRLRPLVPDALLKQSKYTLILFGMKQRVVRSSIARQALEKLEPHDDPIIATGPCFTRESIELLEAHDILTFSASDYLWTDQSYEEVRTLIGTKVKRPLNS